MKRTSIVLGRPQRRRLLRTARRTRNAALRTRYMIVLHKAAGETQKQIAAALGTSIANVQRTRTRCREHGAAVLIDRREDNGVAKADESYAADLLLVLQGTPRDH